MFELFPLKIPARWLDIEVPKIFEGRHLLQNHWWEHGRFLVLLPVCHAHRAKNEVVIGAELHAQRGHSLLQGRFNLRLSLDDEFAVRAKPTVHSDGKQPVMLARLVLVMHHQAKLPQFGLFIAFGALRPSVLVVGI